MQACFLHPTGTFHPRPVSPTTATSKGSPNAPETMLQPVNLGNVHLNPPIILAPMAAVTNPPFRKLCSLHGARLMISEMLHASLYLSNKLTLSFNASEIRSVQLYGTDATTLTAAARRLVEESGVQHIDLNFGCPAPKVLKQGGGAALPSNLPKFEAIVSGAVKAGVPVTCKLRAGHGGIETFLEAAMVAEACGVSAVTLHGRTAEEGYDRGAGRRGWHRIRRLVEALDIPVFGNGDVFTGTDALEMVEQTGCAGVVVGRGCLGRPWLFADIVDAFDGIARVRIPEAAVVLQVMVGLIEEIVAYLIGRGMEEARAVKAVRRWYGWFLQGYHGTERLVETLVHAEDIDTVQRLVRSFDGAVRMDREDVLKERGKLGRE